MNSVMKSDARGSCTVGSDADGLKILRGGQTTCKSESFRPHLNKTPTIKQFDGLKSKLTFKSIPKGTFPLPRTVGSTGYTAIAAAGTTPKPFYPSLRQHDYPISH